MMSWFSKNKIIHNFDIIAKELKEGREEKKLTLEEVSKKINLSTKYLEAIEDGKMDKLPQGLYGKNYLREYALFLGKDVDSLLELYAAESNGTDKENIFSRKKAQVNYTINIPKILRNTIISLIILVSLVYLGYSLRAIISPPPLQIFEPADNYTIKENSILVKGQTILESSVEINGEEVLTDTNGRFEKRVNLKTGLNSIIIKARKSYSRTQQIVKNVLVE